jgi:serine/threonine protein kinase
MDEVTGPQSTLAGKLIVSEVQPGVRYRLTESLGEGAMGVAYLAQRESPTGTSPVVVKAVRPVLSVKQVAPELIARKEAVALGRLNERVPPSPFVVRFVDTGSAPIFVEVPSPWLAIEYVHGGVEGTTLEDRVRYSITKTGFAFDALRASHAVKCLSQGLSAIHSVDVIHRDLTPGNVLCCGFGEAEIFKISDFGVARPVGLDRTFGEVGVGTLGYAAPEQMLPGMTPLRAYTDVFSLACVTYFLITGRSYFTGGSPVVIHEAVESGVRRSISENQALCPEIAERPEAIEAIDAALARATSADVSERHPTAERFAAHLMAWLGEAPSRPRSSRRLVTAMVGTFRFSDPKGWSWSVRQLPRSDLIIKSASWDTDGRCFALTTNGPRFWNGEVWLDANQLQLPPGMSFATRYEAGGWLVGGAAGRLALCNTDGVSFVLQTPDPGIEFIAASGHLDGVLAAVGRRAEGPPMLLTFSERRWLEPLPLHGVSHVTCLMRLDEKHWLFAGRLDSGVGFVARFEPARGGAELMPAPPTRAYVAGACAPERGLAIVVGAHGATWRIEQQETSAVFVEGEPDLTASSVDILDREWVASAGALWTRDPEYDPVWRPVWKDLRWQTPFVSLISDPGMVMAMTADGGIVEGRDPTIGSR